MSTPHQILLRGRFFGFCGAVLATALGSGCAPAEDEGEQNDPVSANGKADEIEGCGEDRTCLRMLGWDVRFTNPLCGTYEYATPVERVGGGDPIATKPKNVWCTPTHDAVASGSRESSPQSKIVEWLEATGEGDDIFAASLSFSDARVADAMCAAIDRGATLTFVIDQMSSKGEQVKACGGDVLVRGHQGSIGFAHVKLLMINPHAAGPADPQDGFVRLAFGSGNMSSGTHLHHENWHFIEPARDTFFTAAHACLAQALVDPALTDGKTPFRSFMNECRGAIEHEPEDDVIPFFIPVREDSQAITALMKELVADAESVDIGAHRFSWSAMIDALVARLADEDRAFALRLIADDDLYWLDPLPPSKAQMLGPNDFNERDQVRKLRTADGAQGRFEDRYMETNHSAHLLHHSKYLVFHGLSERGDAMLVGSANLTGTGFGENLENFYYVDIPEIVEELDAQYTLMWDGEGDVPQGLDVPPRATAREDMPIEPIVLDEPVAEE